MSVLNLHLESPVMWNEINIPSIPNPILKVIQTQDSNHLLFQTAEGLYRLRLFRSPSLAKILRTYEIPLNDSHNTFNGFKTEQYPDGLYLVDKYGESIIRIPEFQVDQQLNHIGFHTAQSTSDRAFLVVANPTMLKVYMYEKSLYDGRVAWKEYANVETQKEFIRSICDNSDDDTPRLIYADWLEEHGDPDRARFIRLQCDLANRGLNTFVLEDDPDKEELKQLLSKNERRWLSEMPTNREMPSLKGMHFLFRGDFFVDTYLSQRGFPGIHVNSNVFLKKNSTLKELVSMLPIDSLSIDASILYESRTMQNDFLFQNVRHLKIQSLYRSTQNLSPDLKQILKDITTITTNPYSFSKQSSQFFLTNSSMFANWNRLNLIHNSYENLVDPKPSNRFMKIVSEVIPTVVYFRRNLTTGEIDIFHYEKGKEITVAKPKVHSPLA
jgi:uncharacterized protein (TIGR02996 family)